MGYLRLRQICLVASDLATTEKQVQDVLGLEICFRDPGVGKYGLHNALFAMGGTFLEIVSPTKPDTAAGRYLERRKGDGGYMYIVDCDNLEARRDHFKAEGVRLVEDLHTIEWGITGEALHLHPRDTGGCLLSVDRHSPGTEMMGSYKWAGPKWQEHDRSQTITQIVGAAIQSADPAELAAKWSHQKPSREAVPHQPGQSAKSDRHSALWHWAHAAPSKTAHHPAKAPASARLENKPQASRW